MRISDWSSDVCSSDLFAGQQPFGESGDEDDWHRKFCQYVLDRIDPAAVIGKLNVSQHQARPLRHGFAHGFIPCHRNRRHLMAQIPHDGFQVHRNNWLIFNDQHLGRSEEHTSELQSLMRISYAVFCLKKKKKIKTMYKT